MLSVVMPTLNSSRFVSEAIRSVLTQAPASVEVIVQDGGSTDGTIEVARAFADPRIALASAPDDGQSQALNRALERIRGEWVLFLNADDLVWRDALSVVAPQLTNDLDIVYGDFLVIDEHGRQLKRYRPSLLSQSRLLRKGCYLFSGATYFRRAFLDTIGPLDEGLHYSMDYDLFLRAAAQGRSAYCPQILGAFRRHAGGKTTRSGSNSFREDLRVRLRHTRRQPKSVVDATLGQCELGAYVLTRPLWHSRAWLRLKPESRL